MDKLLLTISEAAHALSLGRSKSYELVSSGELAIVRVGRAVRVPADEVRALVERLRTDQNERTA